MNWSDERYVRIYTRDTADLIAVGWEGRAVLWELVRKVDRAGVLDHGGDGDLIAGMLGLPVDMVRMGLERLAKRGTIVLHPSTLVIPNFIAAQEERQSDKRRQSESRARRRDRALAEGAGEAAARAAARPDYYRLPPSAPVDKQPDGLVTSGHTWSQPVTERDQATAPVTERDQMRSQNVTIGHQRSHVVTGGHSVPSRAVPIYTVPESGEDLHGAGGAGHKAPGSPEPDGREYAPLPSEPPPDLAQRDHKPANFRHQEPPRYDRPAGATAGSVSAPRVCARCGREGGSTVLEAGKNICRSCYEKRPTADADARAAALELARRFGCGPLLADGEKP